MFMIGFQTERSETMEKDIGEVYSMVADFNTWRNWSPWICQEPDCPVEIKGQPGEVGHYQEWNGKRIGAGNMTITETRQNEKLEYALSFLKPWKSTAKVAFEFQKNELGTQVRWHMDGSLPIFLFFMKKQMSAWVGCDYERGLSMLKDQLETGEVLSASDYQDVVAQGPFHYVGLRTRCTIDEIGQKMEADFNLLEKDLKKGKLPQPDAVVSFYPKYDFVSRHVDYISGFLYNAKPDIDSTDSYEVGSAPGHTAIKVVHTGSYRHLGNGWSTAMGARMSLKRRLNKAIPMYEIYKNNPHEAQEKDLTTNIYVPVK